MVLGVKVATTPEGNPETESATGPVNPFIGRTVIVGEFVLDPGLRLTGVDVTENPKSGVGWDPPPPAAVPVAPQPRRDSETKHTNSTSRSR
jgi:hypothetical protein